MAHHEWWNERGFLFSILRKWFNGGFTLPGRMHVLCERNTKTNLLFFQMFAIPIRLLAPGKRHGAMVIFRWFPCSASDFQHVTYWLAKWCTSETCSTTSYSLEQVLHDLNSRCSFHAFPWILSCFVIPTELDLTILRWSQMSTVMAENVSLFVSYIVRSTCNSRMYHCVKWIKWV